MSNKLTFVGFIVAIIRDDKGNQINFNQTGEGTTWDHSWGKLPDLQPGKYTLEVEVGEHRNPHFAYSKNYPAFRRGDRTPRILSSTSNSEGHSVYSSSFLVGKTRIDADTNNICIVMMGQRSDGDGGFENYEIAVFKSGQGVFVSCQQTWHGSLFRVGGRIACPSLRRKNISYPELETEIEKRFPNINSLPTLPEKVEFWEEHLNYSTLVIGEEKEELLVIAMSAPLGLFFMRTKEGEHVMANVNDVIGYHGCPMPTVGSICVALVERLQNCALGAEEIEFYSGEACSERFYSEGFLLNEARVLCDLRDSAPAPKPVQTKTPSVKLEKRPHIRKNWGIRKDFGLTARDRSIIKAHLKKDGALVSVDKALAMAEPINK